MKHHNHFGHYHDKYDRLTLRRHLRDISELSFQYRSAVVKHFTDHLQSHFANLIYHDNLENLGHLIITMIIILMITSLFTSSISAKLLTRRTLMLSPVCWKYPPASSRLESTWSSSSSPPSPSSPSSSASSSSSS